MKLHSLLLGLSLSAASSLSLAETVEKTFDASLIKSLRVESGSGNTIVYGKKGTEAKVVAHKIQWNNDCNLDIQLKHKKLSIVVERKTFSSHQCHVNVEVTLASEADLKISSGSGNVLIKELTGDFDVNLGSGNLNIEKSFAKKFKAKTGSGNVTMDGDLRDAEIKVGSGKVDIHYNKVPTQGGLIIKSGSGSAQVRLPKDSKLNVSFTAGSGHLSNEFDNIHTAPYSITMKAGSGNLKISKL